MWDNTESIGYIFKNFKYANLQYVLIMGQFYNAYSENEREKIKYQLFTLIQHKYQPKIWNVSSCTSFWHYLSTF